MEEVKQQLELLSRYSVECVIVGGVAAALHGSSNPTYDLDVCYARDLANLDRLAKALTAVHATLRGAPKGLPFILDADTLRNGLNFTFDTHIGPLDVLGEIAGVGGFDEAREETKKLYEFLRWLHGESAENPWLVSSPAHAAVAA